MALRKYQIQEIYLSIQQSIGILEAEASEPVRKQLVHISIQLLRAKREMIGTFEEIDTQALPL